MTDTADRYEPLTRGQAPLHNQSPSPSAMGKGSNRALPGSGRDVLRCEGLSDGVDGKGTPTSSDDC
jgi:hypothetical protein